MRHSVTAFTIDVTENVHRIYCLGYVKRKYGLGRFLVSSKLTSKILVKISK